MKISSVVASVLSATAIAALAGCALTPVAPPRGIMYTSQSAPLFPASSTGSVKGEASAHNILFLVGWGDCSVKTAAAKAGITKIKNIDYDLNNYFIFYQKFTVTVYGETGSEAAEPSGDEAKQPDAKLDAKLAGKPQAQGQKPAAAK